MKKLNIKQTKEFTRWWNTLHDYPLGKCDDPNMRFVSKGVVTWNEYDAPEFDLNGFIDFLILIGGVH